MSEIVNPRIVIDPGIFSLQWRGAGANSGSVLIGDAYLHLYIDEIRGIAYNRIRKYAENESRIHTMAMCMVMVWMRFFYCRR